MCSLIIPTKPQGNSNWPANFILNAEIGMTVFASNWFCQNEHGRSTLQIVVMGFSDFGDTIK